MASQELKRMRFEQVERYLASAMTVKEWCNLNHVSESTLYMWMGRYREEAGEYTDELDATQKHKATSEWIELSRQEIADSCALSIVASERVEPQAAIASTEDVRAQPHACDRGLFGQGLGSFSTSQGNVAAQSLESPDAPAPIVVSLAGINVGIPPGSRASDIEAVLKVVHAL